MHIRSGTKPSYRVRDAAPSTLILGNIGVVTCPACHRWRGRPMGRTSGVPLTRYERFSGMRGTEC
jgi:hypothetical protein